ncbi:MAG: chromosome condensation regulator RCC1 [Psychrobacter alimentarius]
MRSSSLMQAMAMVVIALLLTACGHDSDTVAAITVIDRTPPLLTTDSGFVDGYTAVAAVFVSGQVQDSSGIKSLTYTLNEAPAQTLTVDAKGYFDDRILLSLGNNKLTLEATDNAGNIMRSTKTLYLGNTVAAGGSHTGALRDGQLYAWGRNNYGQIGLGLTTKTTDVMGHPDTPMIVNHAPKNLISINYNQNHSLAIDQEGQVYSWGADKYGQLGRGEIGRDDCREIEDCRLDISPIAGIDDAVMVAAGYKHNLVLTKDGSVWSFGANTQGQLGTGSSASSSTPIRVDFSNANDVGHIVQVVASANSSYALDDKGQVWGWGSDAYANLGDGKTCTATNSCLNIHATPTRIQVLDNNPTKSNATHYKEKIIQLAAGRDHVLALTNTESVYGWGLNDTSQLGYNGQASKDTKDAWTDIIVTPTKLPWFTNKEVRRIYANGHASYALLDNVSVGTDSKANGVVYAWGAFGETNSTGKTVYNNLDEPTNKLLHLKNIDTMAVGIMHLIAHEKPRSQNGISDSKIGSFLTWGWSFEGALGNKDTTHIWMYNTPTPVHLPSQI